MKFVVTNECKQAKGIALQGDDNNHYRFLVMQPETGDVPNSPTGVRAVIVDWGKSEIDPAGSRWQHFLANDFTPSLEELVAGKLSNRPAWADDYFSPGGYFRAVMLLIVGGKGYADAFDANFFKKIYDIGHHPVQANSLPGHQSEEWASWVGTLANKDADSRITVAFIRDWVTPEGSLLDASQRQINSFAVEAATGKCLNGRALLLGPGLMATFRYTDGQSGIHNFTLAADGTSLRFYYDSIEVVRQAWQSYPAASYYPLGLLPLVGQDAGCLITQSTVPTEDELKRDGGPLLWGDSWKDNLTDHISFYYSAEPQNIPYTAFPPPVLAANDPRARRDFLMPFRSEPDKAALPFWNYAARYLLTDANFNAFNQRIDTDGQPLQAQVQSLSAGGMGVSDTFLTTSGAPVILTDAHSNGDFVLCITRSGDGQKQISYLAPHTEYTVQVPTGESIDLLCGLLGTEFIRLYAGDTVAFIIQSEQPAYVRVRAKTAQATAAGSRISTSYCCQAPDFTAYPAQGGANQFVSAVGAQVVPLPAQSDHLEGEGHLFIHCMDFFMLPYRQALSDAAIKLNTTDANLTNYIAALQTFEREVASRQRWSASNLGDDQKIFFWNAWADGPHPPNTGPVFFDLESGMPLAGATLRTPQGFTLKTDDGSGTTTAGALRSLTLARGEKAGQLLAISRDQGVPADSEEVFARLAFALAYSRPFMVATQGSPFAKSSALFSRNEITLGEFTFRLDLSATLPTPPIMLFKLMSGIPLVSPNRAADWKSTDDWKTDQAGLLAGRFDLWFLKETFCPADNQQATVLAALDSVVQAALSKAAADSKYADLCQRLTDPDWTGVLFFNAALNVAAMPMDIQMLLGGIGTTLTASYIALDHNAIDSATGEIEQSSICALIHYDAKDLALQDTHYDATTGLSTDFADQTQNHFQTVRLNAVFRHSKLAHFDCAVAFSVPKLLLEPMKLTDGDQEDDLKRNVIVLEGRYVQEPGQPTGHVVFDSHTRRRFIPRVGPKVWRAVKSFNAVDMSLHPVDAQTTDDGKQITVKAEYRIAGNLLFARVPVQSGDPLDLFSFGGPGLGHKLALDGYKFVLTTVIDLPSKGGYTAKLKSIPDADLSTLTVSMHGAGGAITPRSGSLLDTMPWKIVGLRFHDRGSTASDLGGLLVTVSGLDQRLVAPSTPAPRLDLALELSAVMGSLGGLSQSQSKLHAQLILGWKASGDQTKSNLPVIVFIPPRGTLTDGRLRMQRAIEYTFKELILERRRLSQGGTHFVLAMSKLQCHFIGRQLFQGGPTDQPTALTFYSRGAGAAEPVLGWVLEDPMISAPPKPPQPLIAAQGVQATAAEPAATGDAGSILTKLNVSTPKGVDVTLTLGPEALPDGTPVKYYITDISEKTAGTFGNIQANQVTFSPASGFAGTVSFDFNCAAGATSDSATATITVGPSDVAPQTPATITNKIWGRINGVRSASGNTNLEDTTAGDPGDSRRYYTDSRVDWTSIAPYMHGTFSNIRIDTDPNQLEVIEDIFAKLLDIPFKASQLAEHAADLSTLVPGVNYDPTAGTINYTYVNAQLLETYILFNDHTHFFGFKLVCNLSGVDGLREAYDSYRQSRGDLPIQSAQLTRNVPPPTAANDERWALLEAVRDAQLQSLEPLQQEIQIKQLALDRLKQVYKQAQQEIKERQRQGLLDAAGQEQLDDAIKNYAAGAKELEDAITDYSNQYQKWASLAKERIILDDQLDHAHKIREALLSNPELNAEGNQELDEQNKKISQIEADIKAADLAGIPLRNELDRKRTSLTAKMTAVAGLAQEKEKIQQGIDEDKRLRQNLSEAQDNFKQALGETETSRNNRIQAIKSYRTATDAMADREAELALEETHRQSESERELRQGTAEQSIGTEGRSTGLVKLANVFKAMDGASITIIIRPVTANILEGAGSLVLPAVAREIHFELFTLCLPYIGVQGWSDGGFQILVGWPFSDQSLPKVEVRFAKPVLKSAKLKALLKGATQSILLGAKFGRMHGSDFPGKYDMIFDTIWQFGIGLGGKLDRPPDPPLGWGFTLIIGVSIEGFVANFLAETGTSTGNIIKHMVGVDCHYHWWLFTVSASLTVIFSFNILVAEARASVTVQLVFNVAWETDHSTHLALTVSATIEIVIRVLWWKVRASATFKAGGSWKFLDGPLARISGPTPPTAGYYEIAPAAGELLRVMLWADRSITVEYTFTDSLQAIVRKKYGEGYEEKPGAERTQGGNCTYGLQPSDFKPASGGDLTLAFQGIFISGGVYNQISNTAATLTISRWRTGQDATGGGSAVWTHDCKVDEQEVTLWLLLSPDQSLAGAFVGRGDLPSGASLPCTSISREKDKTEEWKEVFLKLKNGTHEHDVGIIINGEQMRVQSVRINQDSLFTGNEPFSKAPPPKPHKSAIQQGVASPAPPRLLGTDGLGAEALADSDFGPWLADIVPLAEPGFRDWLAQSLPRDPTGRLEFPVIVEIQPTAVLDGHTHQWQSRVITSLVMPLREQDDAALKHRFPLGFEDLSALLLETVITKRADLMPPEGLGIADLNLVATALKDSLNEIGGLQEDELRAFFSRLRFNLTAVPPDLTNKTDVLVAPLPMFPELGHRVDGADPEPFVAPLAQQVVKEYFDLLLRQLIDGLEACAKDLEQQPNVRLDKATLQQHWETTVKNAAGLLARFFLQGARVYGRGLFEATGQQFDAGKARSITLVLYQPADYLSVPMTLTPGPAAFPYITIGATVPIAASCKISGQFGNALWSNNPGPLKTGDVTQVAAIADTARVYSLKPGDWLTTDAATASAPRYRFNFLPLHLLDDLAGRSPDFDADTPFHLQLATWDSAATKPGEAPAYQALDSDHTHFALTLELPLKPAGKLNQQPVFELGALGEEQRELLEALIRTETQTPGLLTAAAVAMMTGRSSGAAKGQRVDVTFEPVTAVLSRTNVSTTEVKDVDSSPFCATLPPLTSPATEAERLNFLTLVWEASVINAAGYHLYLRRDLIGNQSAVRAYLFLKFDTDRLRDKSAWRFVNSLFIDEQHKAPATAPLHLNTPLVVMPVNQIAKPQTDPSPKARKLSHAVLPAGLVEFEFTHAPQEADLHHSPAAYLSGLYHLYQVRMLPAGDAEAGWSPTLTHRVTDDKQWHYRGSVPVVPDNTNPYARIGQPVTLEFRVLDIYGNLLPDKPQWTSAKLTYTDVLIGPAHWGGLSVSWDVKLPTTGGPAALNLYLVYQPERALTLIPSHPGERSHLDEARHKYQSILWQLEDANLQVELATPLAFGEDVDAVQKTVHQALQDFVRGLLKHLQGMHEGDPLQGSDRLTQTLSLPLNVSAFAADGCSRDDLFELFLHLTLSRTQGVNAQDAAKLPALERVTAHLTPHTVSDPNLEDPDKTDTASADHSLRAFAKHLEAAFANYDGQGSLLKVAQGPQALSGVAQSKPRGVGHPHTIWLLKWARPGTAAAKAVQLNFPSPAPQYYAPRPLCTRLLNGEATMRDGSIVKLTRVDLDNWARVFLDEVHQLLSPERASWLASLDADAFRAILRAKITLGEAIAGQLMPVLKGDVAPTKVETEYFEEQLFTSLSADYSTAVMLNVSAMVNRHNGIPRIADDGPNPLFLGRILPYSTDAKKAFTFSNATLQVPDSARPKPERMNFLLSARHPSQQAYLDLGLDFQIAGFDYQFHKNEEHYGFIPSTWLAFANAGARHADGSAHFVVPIGSEFKIPLPLRSFPGLPRLIGQNQAAPDAPPVTLVDALKWDAQFEFARPEAAQDDLIVSFRFNDLSPIINGSGSSKATGLLEALAQFRYDYPALKQQLTDPAARAQLTGAEAQKIAQLVSAVATQWVQLPAADDVLPDEPQKDFSLRITQGGQIVPNAKVTVSAAKSRADRTAFTATTGGDKVTGTISPGVNSWIVTLSGLSLLAHQAIRTYVQTERNSELVPGKKTNRSFVYDTPQITFPSALLPSTDFAKEISLKQPSLKASISNLFADLTTNYNGKIRLELKLGARVVLANAATGEQLTAMLPLFLSDVDSQAQGGAILYEPGTTPVDYRQSLLDRLRHWHSGLAGDASIEAIELDLTVFSSLTTEQLLLARVRRIEFVVGGKTWWTDDGDFPSPPAAIR